MTLAYAPEKVNTIPLIHIVNEDDQILFNSSSAEWFKALHDFPWEPYCEIGATYYNALYQFNIDSALKHAEKKEGTNEANEETLLEAEQRLLFARVTMLETQEGKLCVLHNDNGEEVDVESWGKVNPSDIAPGKVPLRYIGRKPKDFFAMFKAFIAVSIMGFPPEPEIVHKMLQSNLSLQRRCGFLVKREHDEYHYMHPPCLRKLEQFDQIMTQNGLWSMISLKEVRENISSGLIEMENELVGDTTHYHAYSGFETIEYTDENGKEVKKSQSKTIKSCRCKDRNTCEHDWVLADDGAGTVVKSGNKKSWAHKASMVGFPKQGIPLDVRAVSDAATHDGETFFPHIERLLDILPEVAPYIDRVLYDSACCSRDLKEKFLVCFGIELKASFNPRRKKPITEGLPRGIDKISPYGVPVCMGGYEMEFKGNRYESERFIYQSPKDEDGTPVCHFCERKEECCPNSKTGRTISVPFDILSHIDPNDPPMSKRFKAIMKRRPSVERMIKRLKCDLSDDRLRKRGNKSFQAYLDKTMIAFHILLRQ